MSASDPIGSLIAPTGYARPKSNIPSSADSNIVYKSMYARTNSPLAFSSFTSNFANSKFRHARICPMRYDKWSERFPNGSTSSWCWISLQREYGTNKMPARKYMTFVISRHRWHTHSRDVVQASQCCKSIGKARTIQGIRFACDCGQ
jgi:hypothetical protein